MKEGNCRTQSKERPASVGPVLVTWERSAQWSYACQRTRRAWGSNLEPKSQQNFDGIFECGKSGGQISRKDHIAVKLSSDLFRKINVEMHHCRWCAAQVGGDTKLSRCGNVAPVTWAQASNTGVLAADVACLKEAKPIAAGFCNVVPSWFCRLRRHREGRNFH